MRSTSGPPAFAHSILRMRGGKVMIASSFPQPGAMIARRSSRFKLRGNKSLFASFSSEKEESALFPKKKTKKTFTSRYWPIRR
jgi:hypothetical protein